MISDLAPLFSSIVFMRENELVTRPFGLFALVFYGSFGFFKLCACRGRLHGEICPVNILVPDPVVAFRYPCLGPFGIQVIAGNGFEVRLPYPSGAG